MTEIKSSEQFDRRFAKICSKKPKVAILLANALRLLTQKDFSPQSLKVHKLYGDLKGRYAFSLTFDLRGIFKKSPDQIILLNIGTHDDVY